MLPNKFSEIYKPGVGPAALFYPVFVKDSAKAYFNLQPYAIDASTSSAITNQINLISNDIAAINSRPTTSNYEGTPFGKEIKAEYLKVLNSALADKRKKINTLVGNSAASTAASILTGAVLPSGTPNPAAANTIDNLLNNPAVQVPTTNAPITGGNTPLTLDNITTPKDTTAAPGTPSAQTPTETVKESFKSNKTLWYAGIGAFVLIGGIIVYKNRK